MSQGATLETLRRDFSDKEKAAAGKSDSLESAKAQFRKYLEMREQLEVLFAGKRSAVFSPEQAQRILMEYPTINADNWQNVDQLIEAQQNSALCLH